MRSSAETSHEPQNDESQRHNATLVKQLFINLTKNQHFLEQLDSQPRFSIESLCQVVLRCIFQIEEDGPVR